MINSEKLKFSISPLIVTLLLAACSSAPPLNETSDWQLRETALLALDHWQLQGRVNARYRDESHTPRIRWRQDENHYAIRLWGTLNAGATLIEGKPGLVTLQQGNETLTATSPEELILERLGYELPVSELNYWIKGVPLPDQEFDMQLGEFNEVTHLAQSGWTMLYEDYRVFGDYSLPRRVEMTRARDNIRLLFIGLDWTVESRNLR